MSGKKELKVKVDLGCNFHCEAEVDDCSLLSVNLGSGIYVQLSHSETVEFCTEKIAILERRVTQLTETAAEIKAEIRLTKEGIRELQLIDRGLEPKKRSIFNF